MGWTRFFRRSRRDAEVRREIESYIQIETDENIARGMAPEASRAAAIRKLGNAERFAPHASIRSWR
ncbi:MAG: permease prefix domain 1-containing protein [Vicinamibacterales bacterium]